jgi:hypothetical protein
MTAHMDKSLLAVILLCASVASSLIAALIWWVIYKKKKKKTTSSGPASDTTASVEGTAVSGGGGGKTNITFYGGTAADDNRLGLTGMDLDAHGKAGLKLNGKPVYAGAVHQFAGPKYLYKVLEVQGGGVKPLYIHVVDICDEKDSVCNKNVKAHGNKFLVDIFQTGFKAAGKDDGLLSGTFKVVGEIPASKIPKNVWKEDYILSKCTGKCADGKDRVWVKASSL